MMRKNYGVLLLTIMMICLSSCRAQFEEDEDSVSFKAALKGLTDKPIEIAVLKNLSDKVRDPKLLEHLEKYIGDKPITVKLTSVGKLSGSTAGGLKVKGSWKGVGQIQKEEMITKDQEPELLQMSYDAAVRRCLDEKTHVVDIILELPPVQGLKNPSIIYSTVVSRSMAAEQAGLIKSSSVVKLHPRGETEKGYNLGLTSISLPMRAGLIDGGWAKGKTIFRTGQSMGTV